MYKYTKPHINLCGFFIEILDNGGGYGKMLREKKE